MQNERGLKVKRGIHVSDDAASQYKSRTPFADVTCSSEDCGFPDEKRFSDHGMAKVPVMAKQGL